MQDQEAEAAPIFPTALRDWAGNQSGGVRRLFDDASGRPTGQILKTHLLKRLEAWVRSLVQSPDQTPQVVLLVGGPGNGKTEAIESTVNWLDQALDCNDTLRQSLRQQLMPAAGCAVPRVATAEVKSSTGTRRQYRIRIVQDASVEDAPDQSRAELLADELESALDDPEAHSVYLACVNRGVLDDAMIHVSERGPDRVRSLLQAIIQSVGQGGGSASCWPLEGYPSVAVWPMDVESLLTRTRDDDPAPAAAILTDALAEEKWPPFGSCPARLMCPFCTSRRALAGARGSAELMLLLRWHELATAKRWTFRDFFTLVSYLLSGASATAKADRAESPCAWAATLAELDASRVGQKPESQRSSAIFVLVASLYQHQLFARWDSRVARRLREDLRELGLLDNHTASGLLTFLRNGSGARPPAMIESLLDSLCLALDPAVADPGLEVPVSSTARLKLRDIDARFSQSVASGRSLLLKHKCLSPTESELMGRLAELDRELSTPGLRRKRPDAATRVQHLLRDFACRLVRRSLGARGAVTRDQQLLAQYQRIVEGGHDDSELLLSAAREVSRLLNTNDKFEVSLTTTFGQPMPPATLRAVLVTTKQAVKPRLESVEGRPIPPMRMLRVGRNMGEQTIALTFDLYRSIRLLEAGLSRASLPTEVNALIDSTKARLSGPIVRDPDSLEDSSIELGASGTRIELIGGRFLPVSGRPT
jgi:hypothetical protein